MPTSGNNFWLRPTKLARNFMSIPIHYAAHLARHWSTDALIGNPQAKHLLVALSGTHGVEGYYGSDCQRQWLDDLRERSLPEDVAVLMRSHLINPWGTA